MTENELRTAMGFELCDCDECKTQKPRTACAHPHSHTPKEKSMYSANGYESALELMRTEDQRRAIELRTAAFAAIDAQAEAASAQNRAHFRAMENHNRDRAKYPAPNPYASVLKGAI